MGSSYVMSSVEKFTILGINVALLQITRISFQSVVGVPSRIQMDSKASFIAGGGFPNLRTSSRFAFFIDLTAVLASCKAGSTYN